MGCRENGSGSGCCWLVQAQLSGPGQRGLRSDLRGNAKSHDFLGVTAGPGRPAPAAAPTGLGGVTGKERPVHRERPRGAGREWSPGPRVGGGRSLAPLGGRSAGRASIAGGDAAAAAAPRPLRASCRESAAPRALYWKRAPERREARCTEPGPPCPRAEPGTGAPAAAALRGRPGRGPAPGDPARRQAQEASRVGGRWRELARGRAGDPPGKPRGGCQQLQNEVASLPGILVAAPEGGATPGGTGAPRPAEGTVGLGPGGAGRAVS